MTNNGEQNGKIVSFTQLRSWQKARELTTEIYRATSLFPKEEKFGLSSQLRRSAVSVPGNIAEGFSRNTAKDKAQFYSISLGSLTETLSHLYIAQDLGFIKKTDLAMLEEKVINLHKMINGLIKSAQGRNT